MYNRESRFIKFPQWYFITSNMAVLIILLLQLYLPFNLTVINKTLQVKILLMYNSYSTDVTIIGRRSTCEQYYNQSEDGTEQRQIQHYNSNVKTSQLSHWNSILLT